MKKTNSLRLMPCQYWKNLAEDGVNGEELYSSVYAVLSCQCSFTLECVDMLPYLQKAIPFVDAQIKDLKQIPRISKTNIADSFLTMSGKNHILSLKRDAEVRLMFDALLVIMLALNQPVVERLNIKQYRSVEEFLQLEAYQDFKYETEEEQFKLLQFANYAHLAGVFMQPKSSKTRMLAIVPRITEGKSYSGGGGQSNATCRRVKIYETEFGVRLKPRPWRLSWRAVVDTLICHDIEDSTARTVLIPQENEFFGPAYSGGSAVGDEEKIEAGASSTAAVELTRSTYCFQHPHLADVQLAAVELVNTDGSMLIRSLSLRKVKPDATGQNLEMEDLARSISVARKDDEHSMEFWDSLDQAISQNLMAEGTDVYRNVDKVDGEDIRSVAISRQLSEISFDSSFDRLCEEVSFEEWMRGGSLSRQPTGESGLFRSISTGNAGVLLRGVSVGKRQTGNGNEVSIQSNDPPQAKRQKLSNENKEPSESDWNDLVKENHRIQDSMKSRI